MGTGKMKSFTGYKHNYGKYSFPTGFVLEDVHGKKITFGTTDQSAVSHGRKEIVRKHCWLQCDHGRKRGLLGPRNGKHSQEYPGKNEGTGRRKRDPHRKRRRLPRTIDQDRKWTHVSSLDQPISTKALIYTFEATKSRP